MIPPVMHFVWVGPTTMPGAYIANLRRWVDLHPDWHVNMWTDSWLPRMVNRAQYEAARNPAQASDIIRHDALLAHGGVYLDLDVEPVRPLDPLRGLRAFAAEQGHGLLGTAALGCEPAHPAWQEIVAGLPRAMAEGEAQGNQSGPEYVTPILRAHGVTALPSESFYPYNFDEAPRPPTAGTYGVHTWAASWMPTDERARLVAS